MSPLKKARTYSLKSKGNVAVVKTALKSVKADFILSDGVDTYPLEVTTEMVPLLRTNDVVIGSRLKGSIEPGAMTKMNIVGNILRLRSLGCFLMRV